MVNFSWLFATVLLFISGISSPQPTWVLPPLQWQKSPSCGSEMYVKIFWGEEEEQGSVQQGGYKRRPEAERFEAVDLARLKITKWWQNCRQIKTFPLKSLHYFRHPSLRPPAAATLPDSRTDGIWRMSEYYREEARRKIQRRNRNEIGCRQRGQEKSDRCPHSYNLMLWFEIWEPLVLVPHVVFKWILAVFWQVSIWYNKQ